MTELTGEQLETLIKNTKRIFEATNNKDGIVILKALESIVSYVRDLEERLHDAEYTIATIE